MSGNLAPLPIWQFVDQNGHPLAGGSVAWYQAGTQNRVTIYSDLALETPLPNPVPLDSAGRPTTASGPTPMFFDPSRAYKQVLTDATGRIVWTADNIVSPGTGATGPPGPPGTGTVNSNYSEGDWTPALVSLVDGSPGSGTTYAQQLGHWTRIGRLVFVTGRLVLSALGTWTADPQVMLAGLPFGVATAGPADDLDVGAVVMTFFRNLATTDYRSLYGTAEAIPRGFALMGLWAPLNLIEWLHPSNFTDTTDFSFTGFYQTSDPGPDDGASTSAPLSEEIAIGEQPQIITLNSGHALHVVNCENAQTLPLNLVTSTPQPSKPGERLMIVAAGPGPVLIYPGDLEGNTSFVNEVTSGPTPLHQGIAEYVFSSIWGAWRLISHRQNMPIITPFDAGNYYARQPSGNVWTVTAENVLTQKYELVGKKIRFWLELVNTTFTGYGSDLIVQRFAWGGYQPVVSTQNAGLVFIGDSEGLVLGAADVWDVNAIRILNFVRPFQGPTLSINAALEFEVQ